MNINMYVINAILVLMVVRQIREHSLDLRSLAVPVLAVGAAAVMFLHSVPGGGNDIALELLGVSAGAAMGAVGGLATRLRRAADGRALGRAGALAAGMWVAGVGGRMAFVFATTHGAGPAIGRFSIAHHITGSDAWVAALVMMALADVLTRLAVSTPAQPGGQAADRAHGRAGRHAEQLQRDVVAAARHRVQEHDRGGAHGQHRDGQGPQVQGVLADLADDHQDEDCVDHVHVDVHAVSVPRGTHPGRRPTGGSPG
jgi:hypothetical protein